MENSAACAVWGDPGGADQIGCERLDDVSVDELLLGVGLTLAPLALAAPAAISVASQVARWAFPTLRMMANPKWWVTGTRGVAGTIGVLPNLSMQFWEHGPHFSRYNLSSVAFDYAVAASGYIFASWVIGRYGVRIMRLRSLAVWRPDVIADWAKLGKQQALFTMYGVVIGLLRGKASKVDSEAGAKASMAEGWLTAIKSQCLQTFLLSPQGKAMFPRGMKDPRVAAIDRIISLIQNVAVRAYYGVVPGGGDGTRKWSMPPSNGGQDPIFGSGVGF